MFANCAIASYHPAFSSSIAGKMGTSPTETIVNTMSATSETSTVPPLVVSNSTALWLREAAIAIGAPEEHADDFSKYGAMLVNDVLLLAQQRSDMPDDWLVTACMPRPEAVKVDRWHKALLAANGRIMQLNAWSFATDANDSALLTWLLPPDCCIDPLLLSSGLYGLLGVMDALRTGVLSEATAGSAMPSAASGAAPDALGPKQDSDGLDLELPPLLPPQIHALLEKALDEIGCPAKRMALALNEGRLEILGREIALCGAADDDVLLVCAEIDKAVTAGGDASARALQANTLLTAAMEICIAHTNNQPVLIGRCPASGLTPHSLLDWLGEFSAFAQDFDTSSKDR